MNLKDIFSRYQFMERKNIADLEITILHRGAPDDKKMIKGSGITVYRSYFEYSENGELTHIPFHRILEIREKGKLLYRKTKPS